MQAIPADVSEKLQKLEIFENSTLKMENRKEPVEMPEIKIKSVRLAHGKSPAVSTTAQPTVASVAPHVAPIVRILESLESTVEKKLVDIFENR